MDEGIPHLQERQLLEHRDFIGLDYPSLYMCKPKRSMKRDDSKDTYKLPHRLIEKKRRDRINECIAQLKDLLPEHLKLTTLGHLEKAVVLELTLKHLKALTALTEQQHQKIIALQNGKSVQGGQPTPDEAGQPTEEQIAYTFPSLESAHFPTHPRGFQQNSEESDFYLKWWLRPLHFSFSHPSATVQGPRDKQMFQRRRRPPPQPRPSCHTRWRPLGLCTPRTRTAAPTCPSPALASPGTRRALLRKIPRSQQRKPSESVLHLRGDQGSRGIIILIS
ncbi:Class E basic helix-loop-helix protein 41 [Bos mutus]|uniref:Class E basic helix-loop-helix protein 40 n=1 Tax=Bos mutus TaxID=72004 RepID=L8I4T3_9CETA|nr:Class E basic helix-loop-helix protein 41 [Bos mutus]